MLAIDFFLILVLGDVIVFHIQVGWNNEFGWGLIKQRVLARESTKFEFGNPWQAVSVAMSCFSLLCEEADIRGGSDAVTANLLPNYHVYQELAQVGDCLLIFLFGMTEAMPLPLNSPLTNTSTWSSGRILSVCLFIQACISLIKYVCFEFRFRHTKYIKNYRYKFNRKWRGKYNLMWS